MSARTKELFPKFGEIVVRKRLASPRVVNEALALQQLEQEELGTPLKLGELLVMKNILNHESVRDILDEQKLGRSSRRVLRIKTRVQRGVVIIALAGRLDEVKGEVLKQTIDRLSDKGENKFAIDAERLVYVNIAGISSILSLIDDARSRGGDIKFFNMVYGGFIFERLGLHRFIQIFETAEQAVSAFALSLDEYTSRGSLGEYVAAQNGKLFHLSYCKKTELIPLDTKIYFQSKHHARADGKEPCRLCKP